MSSSSSIPPLTGAAGITGTTSSLNPALPQQTLSQNDFLQLLVTQMTSQDPMNPTSDTQMAAQMAQFTSLTQTNTMSSNIASLLTQQQMSAANGMIGRNVSLQVDATNTTSGVVQSVQVNSGTPEIVVNGTAYNLSQVLSITPAAAATPSTN